MEIVNEGAGIHRRESRTEGFERMDAGLLGRAAGRALVFQSYLIRRAWGVYYAIWAAALVTFFVFPASVAAAYPSLPPVGELLYYLPIVVVVVLAIWATSWSFGQTFRALRFRQALRSEAPRHWHFYIVLAVGLAIFALVTWVAFVNSFAGLLVLDACLGVVNLWILVAVRDAFSRVPPEGTIAVGTYAISVVGSAAALLLTHSQSWFGAFWIVAIIGWAFSAVYALYHAAEEMTGDVGA